MEVTLHEVGVVELGEDTLSLGIPRWVCNLHYNSVSSATSLTTQVKTPEYFECTLLINYHYTCWLIKWRVQALSEIVTLLVVKVAFSPVAKVSEVMSASFEFAFCILFKHHLICCIWKLGPNHSCGVLVTSELFHNQMYCKSYHNILISGICPVSDSLPEVQAFLFQLAVYMSHILFKCFRNCLRLTASKNI